MTKAATQANPTETKTATAFHVSSQVLLSMLGYLAPAIGSKSVIAALSGVLIEAADGALRMRSSNLDQNIIVQCKALVNQPGQVVIPFKELQGFASALAGDTMLAVTATATRATITAERAKATIDCYNPDDFPTEPTVREKIIELPAGHFLRAVEMVEPAVQVKDDGRIVLMSMLFRVAGDTLMLAGADGFRLGEARLPLAEPQTEEHQLLVPRLTLRSLAKLIDPKGDAVSLSLADKNKIAFQQGDRLLVSNTVEGKFPDYRRIIPAEPGRRIVAPAGVWQQAIRVASALGDGDNGNGCLHITVPARGETGPAEVMLRVSAEATMTATVDAGEAEVLKANYEYLADAISGAADGEAVAIDYRDVTMPIRVEAVSAKPGPEFVGIVMPMHEGYKR